MKEIISGMKDITLCETMVTIKSTMKEENISQLEALVNELM